MGINKRLKELEDKVFKRPELGSSKLLISDPVEESLITHAQEIIKSYPNATPAELTPDQREIVDQASQLMWFRAIDIFRTAVGGIICRDNKWLQATFDMWLTYFVDEAYTGLTQMRIEDEIMGQKGKSWKKKEKELAEVFGPNSEKWVKVFTRERFENYISDFIERGMKPEVREKLRKHREKKKVTA